MGRTSQWSFHPSTPAIAVVVWSMWISSRAPTLESPLRCLRNLSKRCGRAPPSYLVSSQASALPRRDIVHTSPPSVFSVDGVLPASGFDGRRSRFLDEASRALVVTLLATKVLIPIFATTLSKVHCRHWSLLHWAQAVHSQASPQRRAVRHLYHQMTRG